MNNKHFKIIRHQNIIYFITIRQNERPTSSNLCCNTISLKFRRVFIRVFIGNSGVSSNSISLGNGNSSLYFKFECPVETKTKSTNERSRNLNIRDFTTNKPYAK